MKVDVTKENLAQCLCLMCPSYSQGCKIKCAVENANISTQDLSKKTHYEKMFCAFEKSKCINFDKGCLCERCDVFKKYGLNKKEFCLKTGGL